MSNSKNKSPMVPKWRTGDIISLYEDSNKLFFYLPNAEDGLNNKTRPPAAHVECRIYVRSFAVLRSLARLLFVTHVNQVPEFEYYRLADELSDENGCPRYLDAFEDYIRNFGDKWFDTKDNREIFFDHIIDAFLSIVTNLAVLTGNPIKERSDFNFDLSSFIEEFRDAARRERAMTRETVIPSLLKNFKRIRTPIEEIFKNVRAAEDTFLSKTPKAKPLTPTKPFNQWLKSFSSTSRKKGDLLLKRMGDNRPDDISGDSRYDRIKHLSAIWHRMSPSVTRFVELCHLVEEGAILATKGAFDLHLSQRDWISTTLLDLAKHPKYKNAKSLADLAFTESEQDQMSVAFKGMALSLLRYRNKIRGSSGIGHIDPDAYDDFIQRLPTALGPETRDYKACLFKEDSAQQNDNYNSWPFQLLGQLARPRRHVIYYLYSETLDRDCTEVEGVLKRAFATGSRETIESTYDKLIAKYFKNKGKRPKQSDKADSPLDITPTETAPNIDIPEPGKDFKQVDRFAYAPKFRTIIDMDHRGGTYCLKAYENLTAASVVEIIKTLVNAIGKKDGWVKASQNWRIRFKDQPYKRFKNEQIEVGTRANQHLGEWRIIPRDYFQELTKAPKAVQPKPSHR